MHDVVRLLHAFLLCSVLAAVAWEKVSAAYFGTLRVLRQELTARITTGMTNICHI